MHSSKIILKLLKKKNGGHLKPGLFMNFFNTDALSGACAGSLLEKIPYAEEKKSGVWDSISRPLPR